jgi:glycosyltransferase involved in cell wall biosynthesis
MSASHQTNAALHEQVDTRSLAILHVTAPADGGGLESVVTSLAAGMRVHGHDIRVVSVHARAPVAHPFVAGLRDQAIPVDTVVIPPRAYRRERDIIEALCGRHRPNAIHTHGFRSDVIGGWAARRLGIPQVSTVHGFTGNGWRVRGYERVQEWALRRAHVVCAVSRPLVKRLMQRGIPPDRLEFLPNGFAPGTMLSRDEARRRLGLSNDRFTVGWVGRLSHEKGADVALRALARITDPSVALSVIGSGAEEPALRMLASSLGITDRVAWHGRVQSAEQYFRAFDAFLLSSRTEGTPMVLLEAMAARIPAVVARVGGVPDVVSEAEAWLVRAEDAEAFAVAIMAARSAPHHARDRSIAAYERWRRAFSLEPWLARHEDIYRRVARTVRR